MGRKPTCECGACKKCLHREYMNRWYDDYSKPLEIRWLCATCHGREHRKVA